MTAYKRGDVILVDIPFSGSVGRKRRPAVILSTASYNSVGIKLIVAALTSNVAPPFRPGDGLLRDWRTAGLLKPSSARDVLATVDRAEVVRKLGAMSEGDFANVEHAIADILGFASASPPLATEDAAEDA